ncbi:MAG: DUF1080 domain-containing protein [Bacteroidales bacterium]
MKSLYSMGLLAAIGLTFLACDTKESNALFNGNDLSNWTFFSDKDSVDMDGVFWVEDGMIQTSGIPNGYIRSKGSYSNYDLHVEWRWMEEPVNSGVLIHVQGEDRLWPQAIECQLMHEHAGDLVLMGKGTGITVRDTAFMIESEENRYKVLPKWEAVSELSAGEWNSYDISSMNGRLEVKVNGVLQHVGTAATLTEGNILLQSEGAPLQFRNITLTPR